MTSVQSHLLRLNGSKMSFTLFISVFLLACSSTKEVTRNKRPTVINPDPTEKVEEKKEEVLAMDTVRWVEVPDSEFVPISDETGEDNVLSEVRESTYDVALLIPFRLMDYDMAELDANNAKFAHFYSGLKMALGKSDADIRIRIRTYQTNRKLSDVEQILAELERDMPDLIIGPYETDALSKAASFAKDNEIPLISPWKASNRVTSDNLFYLQMRPNVPSYYDAILKHMNASFDRESIRVISNANGRDKSIISYIQKSNQEKSILPLVEPLKEFQISEDSLLYSDSLIFRDVFEEGANVFFLPQYNVAKDEGFIYECLRKLNAEKGNRDIYVYTMPITLNSDKVDLNILKNLHIRVCEYKYADDRDPIIQRFKNDFYQSYGWLPNEDSYFGYDMMNFVLYGLEKYGKYFHYYMKDETLDLSQMSIKVEAYLDSNGELAYLMNNNFYIIEYENNHFNIKQQD